MFIHTQFMPRPYKHKSIKIATNNLLSALDTETWLRFWMILLRISLDQNEVEMKLKWENTSGMYFLESWKSFTYLMIRAIFEGCNSFMAV